MTEPLKQWKAEQMRWEEESARYLRMAIEGNEAEILRLKRAKERLLDEAERLERMKEERDGKWKS